MPSGPDGNVLECSNVGIIYAGQNIVWQGTHVLLYSVLTPSLHFI